MRFWFNTVILLLCCGGLITPFPLVAQTNCSACPLAGKSGVTQMGTDTPNDSESSCYVRHALKDLTSDWPLPVSISPDHEKLFMRGISEDGKASSLEVLLLKSGKRLYLSSTEPDIRLRWSPDSSKVVYMTFNSSDTNPGRELRLWNLTNGKSSRLSIPHTDGVSQIEWSPNGRYVGYIDSASDVMFVVDIDKQEIISKVPHVLRFAWSPESERLAIVDVETLQDIYIVGIEGSIQHRIKGNQKENTSNIFWPNTVGGLYVIRSTAGINGEVFVDNVDIASGQWKNVVSAKGILKTLVSSTNGDRYAIALGVGSGQEYLWGSPGSHELHVVNYTADLDDLQGISSDGQYLYTKHTSSSSPSELMININSGHIQTLYEHKSTDISISPPKTIWIPSFDNVKIPVILWTSPNRGTAAHRLLVYSHGATHDHATAGWLDWIQVLLIRGFDVALVNYRGSNGYTDELFHMNDPEGAARDILSACEYFHVNSGVSYKDIVVLGHSIGTLYALRAYMIQPDHIGMLVLVSFDKYNLKSNPSLLATNNPPDNILIFRPSNDSITPERTRDLIERSIGRTFLEQHGKNIYALPQEEHQISDERSWSIILGNLFEKLGLGPC